MASWGRKGIYEEVSKSKVGWMNAYALVNQETLFVSNTASSLFCESEGWGGANLKLQPEEKRGNRVQTQTQAQTHTVSAHLV